MSKPSPILDLVRDEMRPIHAYQVPKRPGIRIKLDANESPYSLPAEIMEELASVLRSIPFHRYPDPSCAALRAYLASYYGVDEDTILFGNGSDEIIQILATTFAKPKAGQERARMLFPMPSFSVFDLVAKTHGIDTVSVALDEEFQIDAEALGEALREQVPNLAFFARPNNPTGTLWSGEQLLSLCADHPHTLFVSDEAYGEYAPGSLIADVKGASNLFVMKTLSKIGLAGLRLGFGVGPRELIGELEKARPPYNISTTTQVAALWLLENAGVLLRERCAEVVRERARLYETLEEMEGLRVYPSEANLLLLRVGEAGAGAGPRLWQALVDRGILLRTFGSAGDLADCLRLTVGTPSENDETLAVIEELLPAVLAG